MENLNADESTQKVPKNDTGEGAKEDEFGTSSGLDMDDSKLNISQASAHDEVSRIREEMKRNLAARQEALKKFKAGGAKDDSLDRSLLDNSAVAKAAAFNQLQNEESLPLVKSASRPSSADSRTREEKALVTNKRTNKAERMSVSEKQISEMTDATKIPKRPLTRMEKRWQRTSYFFAGVDFCMSGYFLYLGFLAYADDLIMDPLAWQIAFGAGAIFLFLKNFMIKQNMHAWFLIWMLFVFCLLVGWFYGSVRYFFWIYQGDWPCFSGKGEYTQDPRGGGSFGMCYDGSLFISFTVACVYMTFTAFYLWRWQLFTRALLIQRGELKEEVSIDVLLKNVETHLQGQAAGEEDEVTAQKEEARIKADKAFQEYATQMADPAFKAAATGRIAGNPVRVRRTNPSFKNATNMYSGVTLEDGNKPLLMDEADGHEGGLMVNPDVSVKSRLMPSFKKSATVMPGMQAPRQQLVQSSPRMDEDPAALASASPVPSDSALPKPQ